MDRWRRRFWILLAIVVGLPLVAAILLAMRFLPDRPVTYANIEDHFKYGSTGGERNAGFPYWIWKALPVIFKDYLPKNGGQGYEAFGMVYECDNGMVYDCEQHGHHRKDLPVGVMKRRNLGIDRVFVNCAACHATTVREAPDKPARVVVGMPAARFDLGAFEKFLSDIAVDESFRAEVFVAEIARQAGSLGPLDRHVVYPIAVDLMHGQLLMLRNRFDPAHPGDWGPGRVDTWNSAKAGLNFDMHRLPDDEFRGPSDFPSIWNQRQRLRRDDGQRMWLHWVGNNDNFRERDLSAAYGTGATPATVDHAAIHRIEDWLLDAKPPDYPLPIDRTRAARGAVVYKQYCADCHGASGQDFSGAYVGHVARLDQVGTDRRNFDSYTYDLAATQGTNYAGTPYRFTRFRKSVGYANMPLDGIWLRGPYLHNGSVPTLRDLLEPSGCKGPAPVTRPRAFFRGYDVIDPVKVGFISTVPQADGRQFWPYDTSRPGNGNCGHEGKEFGTELPPADKDAIVEYMKTF
jgi:mono/diheme cytochrome c family protein